MPSDPILLLRSPCCLKIISPNSYRPMLFSLTSCHWFCCFRPGGVRNLSMHSGTIAGSPSWLQISHCQWDDWDSVDSESEMFSGTSVGLSDILLIALTYSNATSILNISGHRCAYYMPIYGAFWLLAGQTLNYKRPPIMPMCILYMGILVAH